MNSNYQLSNEPLMSMSFLDYIASALEVYAIKASNDFFSIVK